MTYQLKYQNNYGQIEFGFKSGIVITDISGLSENYINYADAQGMGQIGSSIQGKSIQSKDVVITGEIIGIATSIKQRMIDIILPGVDGQLIFNNMFYLDVVPKVTPVLERFTSNAKFQFTLHAPYPYWRKLNTVTSVVAGLRPLFKFPWNMMLPYKFSERSSEAAANIYNPGNIDTRFTVVFSALSPVQNPRIIKTATREMIAINKLLEAGEVLTVDMVKGVEVYSVINGIRTSNIGYLDIDSELFTLSPGDNIIRYEADANVEGLDVRILFSETVVGVVS